MITVPKRYGQTDGQTTCDRNTALCTKVHRAVKSKLHQLPEMRVVGDMERSDVITKCGLSAPRMECNFAAPKKLPPLIHSFCRPSCLPPGRSAPSVPLLPTPLMDRACENGSQIHTLFSSLLSDQDHHRRCAMCLDLKLVE